MKPRYSLLVILFLFAVQSFAEETWVDLTHELSDETVFWPTAAPFQLRTDAKGQTDKGYYYSAYSFFTAEHGGTHMDAPVHFAENGQSTEQVPLSRLIGEAIVIDVSEKAKDNRDYLVSTEDFLEWEAKHRPVVKGDIVLLNTGYSQYWPDAEKYLGTSGKGAAAVLMLRFPGLHPDAAAWLVEREVASVGIDTASIDYGRSGFFESHVILMTANIPAFENLNDLHLLPATGAFVVALPTKIKGGSGGPLRVVARLPSN